MTFAILLAAEMALFYVLARWLVTHSAPLRDRGYRIWWRGVGWLADQLLQWSAWL